MKDTALILYIPMNWKLKIPKNPGTICTHNSNLTINLTMLIYTLGYMTNEMTSILLSIIFHISNKVLWYMWLVWLASRRCLRLEHLISRLSLLRVYICHGMYLFTDFDFVTDFVFHSWILWLMAAEYSG